MGDDSCPEIERMIKIVNNPQSPLPSVAIDWGHDALQPMAQS